MLQRSYVMGWQSEVGEGYAIKNKLAAYKNGTWHLVQLPQGKQDLPCKWVYKRKDILGDLKTQYKKAHLVAKGHTQQKGTDFDEIFLPVVKMTTLRTVLGLVAIEDL